MTNKRVMKVGLALLAAFVFVGSSCDDGNKSKKEAGRTAQEDQDRINQSFEAIRQGSPVPIFTYSQRWETMLDIMEIQATGTAGTALHRNFDGSLDWWCPTMGTPFPATDQSTGLTQWVDLPGHGETLFEVSQGEPWGGFPGNTSGTWTLCLDDNGKGFAWLEEGEVKWASGTIPNLPEDKRAIVSDSTFVFTTEENVEERREQREELTDESKLPEPEDSEG